MTRVTYEQAFEDHAYLWSIGPAWVMTGDYTDQEDLDELLKNPTKITARDCLKRQIAYWFQVGPDISDCRDARLARVKQLITTDPKVHGLRERYV